MGYAAPGRARSPLGPAPDPVAWMFKTAPRGRRDAAGVACHGDGDPSPRARRAARSHRHELIQELAERGDGMCAPATALDLPTPALDDEALIVGEEPRARRRFTVTEAGREAGRDVAADRPPWERRASAPTAARGAVPRRIDASSRRRSSDRPGRLADLAQRADGDRSTRRAELYAHPGRGRVTSPRLRQAVRSAVARSAKPGDVAGLGDAGRLGFTATASATAAATSRLKTEGMM